MNARWFLSFALPALLWAALLFFLSAQSTLPAISSAPNFDKLEHLGAYGVFGLLLYRCGRGYGASAWRAVVFALVAGALYGVSDEFHQSFVPGRDADVFDALADAVGAGLGGLAGRVVTRLRVRA